MSIWRKAAKRDSAEPAIVAALRKMGASVAQMSKPVDLAVGFRGRTYLAEVKSGKAGRLTPAQELFIEGWCGGEVRILRSVDDAVAWITELSRGDPSLSRD